MPEVTQCPSCQRKLRVPDDLLGKKVRCPSCGTSFTAAVNEEELPTAPLVEDDAPLPARRRPAEEDDEEEAPKRRRRPPEPPEEEDLDEEPPDEEEEDYDERPRRRRRGPLKPHRGTMILVFGILSFLCVPFVFGPMAWIMGNNVLREMRARRMDRSGEGVTNAGRICGMIATFLFLASCAFYAVIIGITIMRGIALKR